MFQDNDGSWPLSNPDMPKITNIQVQVRSPRVYKSAYLLNEV